VDTVVTDISTNGLCVNYVISGWICDLIDGLGNGQFQECHYKTV